MIGNALQHAHTITAPATDASFRRWPMRDVPTPEEDDATTAWRRLLSFLAKGDDNEGPAYERTRSRLIEFFSSKGAINAEELADATLDRLPPKLSNEDL